MHSKLIHDFAQLFKNFFTVITHQKCSYKTSYKKKSQVLIETNFIEKLYQNYKFVGMKLKLNSEFQT